MPLGIFFAKATLKIGCRCHTFICFVVSAGSRDLPADFVRPINSSSALECSSNKSEWSKVNQANYDNNRIDCNGTGKSTEKCGLRAVSAASGWIGWMKTSMAAWQLKVCHFLFCLWRETRSPHWLAPSGPYSYGSPANDAGLFSRTLVSSRLADKKQGWALTSLKKVNWSYIFCIHLLYSL